jgi:hypothetical protein
MILFLLLPHKAISAELWAVTTVKSHHLNREEKYNESNFGIGLEYHFDKTWRAVGGYYDNSYFIHSNYFGGMALPVHLGRFRAGIMAAFISGYVPDYPQSYIVYAAPLITYEGDMFGVNLITLVGGKHKGVIGLQLKFNTGFLP